MARQPAGLARRGSHRKPDHRQRRQPGVPDLRPPYRLRGPGARGRRIGPLELEIERLGTDGAGLARHEGRLIAIAGALPGERVLAEPGEGRRPGRVLELRTRSADRAAPPCPHFGLCGGCVAQHLAPAPYAAWKAARIGAALARAGVLAPAIEPMLISPPGSRRRARLEARRTEHGVILGFHEPMSRRIVDLTTCPVLAPALIARLPACRDLFEAILAPAENAQLYLSESDAGLDVGVLLPGEPSLAVAERLADFAEREDLARLWWRAGPADPVPVTIRRQPRLAFGRVTVWPPPGAFLQATGPGERSLIQTVLDWVGPARAVADLFAGVGTFSLPLGARDGVRVHAVETDERALSALIQAARAAGLNGLTTERRDLELRPLLAHELARFDAVVFDPPRAGARAQSEALVEARVPTVIAVSCDPATFARDAATLTRGPYWLDRVQPIDQFLWSSHLELAALFHLR